MSPAFEAFLARLYVERDARERFLADPEGEARRADLGDFELAALLRIDRVGLEMAAGSFERKRARSSLDHDIHHHSILRRIARAVRRASARLLA